MEINNPFSYMAHPHYSLIIPQARLYALIVLLIVLAFSLTGCVTFNDPEASQEYNIDSVGTLDATTNISQTFISRRPRLNSITIWITPVSDQANPPTNIATNSITIKLFSSPEDDLPVFSTTILEPALGNAVPITIQLADQKNPPGQSYYLQLIKMSGSVEINGRNEDAYPHGRAYINGQAINADIAFRLSYDYDFTAMLQDLKLSLGYLWLAFPTLIVLWLPGWLLLEFSELRQRFNLGEQTAISVGISLALIPIIMLWTTIINIKWTRSGVLFIAGFLVALFFTRVIYKSILLKKNSQQKENACPLEQPTSPRKSFIFHSGTSFALVLILLLSLAVRFIMIRDLATPAWVDSVHHALIIRLIMSIGSYPSTFLPYWDITPTAYHPGFHSIAAAFTWITNLNISQALLILGQVLNALVIFSVYLLAKTLTRNSLTGIFATIIAAFLTPMPAYYTSWGRYTELTGLLILPVALALMQLWVNGASRKQNFWIILLGAISIGGLFMVHYRVIVFLICLILSYLIFLFWEKNSNQSVKFIHVLLLVFKMAVVGMVLILPWLFQTIKYTVLPMIISADLNSIPFFHDFSWAYLTSALGKQTLVLAALGLFWGMVKRLRFTYILLFWTILLFLIANFAALQLPGGGLINNTSVEIMLFMPISILGGYLMSQIITSWKGLIPERFVILFVGIMYFFVGLTAFIGAKQLVTIINPITILSRSADLPAIEWISVNIPENETIVINPFNWGYGLYAGSDGGYWISPLSGRQTLPPPLLYGMGSNSKNISKLSQDVIDLSSDPLAIHEFLRSNKYHYIYLGTKGGVLSPEKLIESGLFTICYQQDGVWIFGLKPGLKP